MRSSTSSATQAPDIPWEEILEVLFRRWKLIGAIVVLFSLLGLVRVALSDPLYRATATIMLQEKRARYTVSPAQGFRPTEVRSLIDQEAALLRSHTLTRTVLSRFPIKDSEPTSLLISLLYNPLNSVSTFWETVHDVRQPSPLDRWVAGTIENIRVRPIPQTSLIDVSFVSRNPEWAAKFVNELISEHIDHNVQLSEPTEALEFFQRQRDLLSNKLGMSQRALDSFREQHGLEAISLPDRATGVDPELTQLEQNYTLANTQLVESRAQARYLSEQLERQGPTIHAPSTVTANPAIQLLRTSLVELELERSDLLTRYAPSSTVISDIDQRIGEVAQMLDREMKAVSQTAVVLNPTYQALEIDFLEAEAQRSTLLARTASLAEQIERRQRELELVAGVSSELERLENEVASAREAYLNNLRNEEEARFSNALDQSRMVNITVTESAQVPTRPQPSGAVRVLALAAFFGVIVAVGIAVLLDWLDPSVKSSAQARRLTGCRILAEIPS